MSNTWRRCKSFQNVRIDRQLISSFSHSLHTFFPCVLNSRWFLHIESMSECNDIILKISPINRIFWIYIAQPHTIYINVHMIERHTHENERHRIFWYISKQAPVSRVAAAIEHTLLEFFATHIHTHRTPKIFFCAKGFSGLELMELRRDNWFA